MNFRIECHDLNENSENSGLAAPEPDVQGTQLTEFELMPFEDCLFSPQAWPANSKPIKANAASAVDFSQWKHQTAYAQVGPASMDIAMVLPRRPTPSSL